MLGAAVGVQVSLASMLLRAPPERPVNKLASPEGLQTHRQRPRFVN